MSTIIRHVIDDLLITVRQTYDDRQVSRAQMTYWVLLVGNRLKSQHIPKRSSGAFLSVFTEIPILNATTNQNRNIVAGRKRIELPATIFDYDEDDGIDYIAYQSTGDPGCPPKFTNITFTRTTIKTSERLYYTKYEKPSPSNPYFYRVGNFVYFLGLENINVKELESGLYTTLDPLTTIDIDQVFDFPDELLVELKKGVLDLARFSWVFPAQDRNNDGDDSTTQQTTVPKVQSVQQQPDDGTQ